MKTDSHSGNGTAERAVLTALIVHDDVLAKVHRHVGKDHHPFGNRHADLITKWCFKHFEKYGTAPRLAIQDYFAQYSEVSKDAATVDMVDTFLSQLSGDYKRLGKEINAQYTMDLAGNLFEKIRLKRIAEGMVEALEGDDLAKAKEHYSSYETTNFDTKAWLDPFDPDVIKDNFKFYKEDRSLIKFPGDLGTFLSTHFERDGFVVFAGPEKRGKSFWLLEIVWQALRQQRRVLYYVFGDMSAQQVERRLYTRIARRPRRAMELLLPRKFIHNPDGVELETDAKEFPALSALDVLKARLRLQALTASKELRLKLFCAGGGVTCAGDIERDVAGFTRQGWVPDVVVIDYADELAAEPATRMQDKRHQINENWRVLRRIALDYHNLVVTATQAAARSYDAKVIRKKDFSEDKRKNAHVTGMLGLNQFGEEKRQGIYRLNWILLRDGEWSENQVIWTAGNLALACPCLLASL